MRVRSKTHARLDNVVIDYPQKAESHPLRIVIAGERKGMSGLEPPMVCLSA
jgi:hypothetical protein